jgi:hypothetical protein
MAPSSTRETSSFKSQADNSMDKKKIRLMPIGIVVGVFLLLFAIYSLLQFIRIIEEPKKEQMEYELSKMDDFKRDWYEKALKSLNEPNFSEFKEANADEACRFLWLRSFHNPVAVRAEIKQDGTGVLFLKVSGGAGGYDPGNILTENRIDLSKKQVSALREIIELDMFRSYKPSKDFGCDGAQWIVEVKKGKEYHYANEWTPKYGKIRKIGLYLIELSGYETADIY